MGMILPTFQGGGRRGRPPRLKPPPEPLVVPRRLGRPRKDPPPAPPPPQLRVRSAGLNPAQLGQQGLGGGHVMALKHPVFKHVLEL